MHSTVFNDKVESDKHIHTLEMPTGSNDLPFNINVCFTLTMLFHSILSKDMTHETERDQLVNNYQANICL
jgi:hypothetical protein